MGGQRIGVIGGGNMARAIVEGCVRSGRFGAGDWIVGEPDGAKRGAFGAMGVEAVGGARAVVERLDGEGGGAVVLAVKPQVLGEVAGDVRGGIGERVVITILAGTPSAKVRTAMGGACRVVRVMPNLPAQIGRGTSALALGAGARAGDDALAREIFAAIGRVVSIDEALMDAFTAVAGSGPAYLFYLGEAMVEAARRVGFDDAQADAIVRSTLAGAALLLESSERGPAELRRAVTSKGGTTEAALKVLEGAGVLGAFVDAIVAARDRGEELAG